MSIKCDSEFCDHLRHSEKITGFFFKTFDINFTDDREQFGTLLSFRDALWNATKNPKDFIANIERYDLSGKEDFYNLFK